MVFDAPAARSPVSPTLPASSASAPLSSEPAGFAVRRTTNSCGIAPALRTRKVTLPARPSAGAAATLYARRVTPTSRAGAAAGVGAPAAGFWLVVLVAEDEPSSLAATAIRFP